MNWINLLLAGIFEVGWAIGFQQMDQHRHLPWTIIFYVSLIASFYFLQQAFQTIPIGTAYAVYTGIGTIGTVAIGILFFKEPFNLLRLCFVLCMITGLIGLKLTSGH